MRNCGGKQNHGSFWVRGAGTVARDVLGFWGQSESWTVRKSILKSKSNHYEFYSSQTLSGVFWGVFSGSKAK